MKRHKGKERGEGMWEALKVRAIAEARKHLRLFWGLTVETEREN